MHKNTNTAAFQKKYSAFIKPKRFVGNSDEPFAEREGFEPPVPRGTTVFKTAAFDHSAISPDALQK